MLLCESYAFLRANSMCASITSSQFPSCSYDKTFFDCFLHVRDFFLLECGPMFWRLPQNCFVSSVRLQPVQHVFEMKRALKEFLVGELDGREPFPVLLESRFFVFHSTLVSSRALICCCPLHAVCTVSFPFALRLAIGCSSARGGLFKLSFTRRETLLTNVLFQVLHHHLFQSGVVSRFTLLSSNLTVQRQ